MKLNRYISNTGFTLIEVVAVIIIAGILATVALKKLSPIADRVRIEDTKHEMNLLVNAITGNAELHNNCIRSDFGYVGDVGALPPDLDALVANPGSYLTWKGPYIKNSLQQLNDDYKKDAWQTEYQYSGGIIITSVGSGENIVRKLAASVDNLLYNRVSGNIYDFDGTPPGSDYQDSLTIRLAYPDGMGSLASRIKTPDIGGFFFFDSIPVGHHPLEIIYLPENDTLRHFISIEPGTSSYRCYYLRNDVWQRIF